MISTFHKTIFVHIPKCGGQSIEHLFLNALGLTWDERIQLTMRANPDPSLGPPRLAHLRAEEYVSADYISSADYNEFFKFSVVRNPTSRLLSVYNYLGLKRFHLKGKQSDGQSPLSFDDFVMKWVPQQFELGANGIVSQNKRRHWFWFIRPQTDYVCDQSGNLLVDRLYRLESMQECFSDLSERFGFERAGKHTNVSQKRVTQSDLTSQHLEVIANLYGSDFDAFDYSI